MSRREAATQGDYEKENKILHPVAYNHNDQLLILVVPADIQMVQIKEEAPEKQRPVDQQDPESLHIKEEEEELWTSLQVEQLNVKEETDATSFSFTAVPLMSEGDEAKPLFSQLHQYRVEDRDLPISSSADHMEAATSEESSGEAKTSRNPDLNFHEDDAYCSESEVSEDDEEKSLFPQLHQNDVEVGDLPTSSSADHMEASAVGESCGGAETTRNPDMNDHENVPDSSETEISEDDDVNSADSQLKHLSEFGSKTENSDEDWEESRSPESGVNSVNKSFSYCECGKQYVNNQSLQRHLTSHLRMKSSNCLVKKNCFKKKKNVNSIKTVQKRLKLFSCDDCDKKFTTKANLDRHVRIHTGEKAFGCKVCGRRFIEKGELIVHMRVHTGEKPFGCEVCGQNFGQRGNLTIHMRIHTGHKPFVCNVCGRSFGQKGNLKTHMRLHTGQKPFACDVCGRRFNQKEQLNSHLRIHSGQKAFSCSVCEQKFTERGSFNKHMRNHMVHKQFCCDVCDRRFSRNGHLSRHMRVHTGQKPFGCDVCGRRFGEKGHLNRHMRMHTGQKPFDCDVCGRKFSEKGHLKGHMRIHTGQKPFSCDFCGQNFREKGNLNRHIKIHTGQRAVVCSDS